MHELAIAQSLSDVASEEARRNGASRILRLTVEVGALAGVVVESLEFCFPVVAAGGMADGASLVVERVGGTGQCSSCGASSGVESFLDPCPQCGHVPLEITAGCELRLKEIEVE